MVIVDTGFWLALANKKDTSHQSATEIFLQLKNEEFIITWCVVTETCYLMQKRVGIDAPKLFIRKITLGMLKVFDLEQTHCPRIEQLMEKYRDLYPLFTHGLLLRISSAKFLVSSPKLDCPYAESQT